MTCSGSLYDICLRQGTTFSFTATFTDSAGNPIDISTWSGEAPIYDRWGSTGIALGRFDLNFATGASGILVYSLHKTGTAALPVSQLVYESRLFNGEEAYEYLYGYIEVNP